MCSCPLRAQQFLENGLSLPISTLCDARIGAPRFRVILGRRIFHPRNRQLAREEPLAEGRRAAEVERDSKGSLTLPGDEHS